jgi:arginase
MEKEYLFAPQWQDSDITNELYDGSQALKKYFASLSENQIYEVLIDPVSVIKLENDIYGYAVIADQLLRIKDNLEHHNPDKLATLGGGCGIEVPIVSYLSGKYSNLQVFWFDAHGDLNSPQSSPSKYFHGMPLRFITEQQRNTIGDIFETIPCKNVHLIGSRDLDDPEQAYITESNMHVIGLDNDYWRALNNHISQKTQAYIHIDLDVIDPQEYKNVKCPVKNGMSINDLVRSVQLIIKSMNVVGMSVVENIEQDINKIKVLRPLLEELIKL